MEFHIGNYANDPAPGRRRRRLRLTAPAAHIQAHLFPERVLAIEVLIHKALVHNHDEWRAVIVLSGKRTATQQRNACGAEVVLRHDKVDHPRTLVGRQFRLALNSESSTTGPGCG